MVVCEPRAGRQPGAGHRGGLLTLLAAPPAPGFPRCPLGDPTACGILQYPQSKPGTQQVFAKYADCIRMSSAASWLWGGAVALGL